jgi:hypothetical protein
MYFDVDISCTLIEQNRLFTNTVLSAEPAPRPFDGGHHRYPAVDGFERQQSSEGGFRSPGCPAFEQRFDASDS